MEAGCDNVTSVSVTALKSSSLTFLPSNAAGSRTQKPTLVTDLRALDGRNCGSVPNQTAMAWLFVHTRTFCGLWLICAPVNFVSRENLCVVSIYCASWCHTASAGTG